ncbi:ABC transporter permease [Gulosibacter molinativorax]|uniref:ABC transporter permease n=1 Tax=Gulosibacter molinativorax TaxID=256821 RepID=UPI00041C19EC|nr:ABC transporter permease [Gulosibacter molinativorax]QUY61227.1 ABC transporter substrate-binding protein [Gulosibacter molinativorax]
MLSAPDEGDTLSFSESKITDEAAAHWSEAEGVESIDPLGILTSRVTAAGDREQTASLFGVAETFTEISPNQMIPTEPGTVVLSERSHEALLADVGDEISIFGDSFTVVGISQDAEYSHTGVIWTTIDDWRDTVTKQTAGEAPFATALLVQGSPADAGALDTEAATESSSVLMSLMAIEVFKSEIGSPALMLGLLLSISALVIGAFFTVWTIQRSKDIAVLKALGASTPSLVRDALGQALVVLVIGVGLGIGLTIAAGAALPAAVPFVISPLTTVVPGVAMVVMGLIGAAFALNSVVKADPLSALNAQNS